MFELILYTANLMFVLTSASAVLTSENKTVVVAATIVGIVNFAAAVTLFVDITRAMS